MSINEAFNVMTSRRCWYRAAGLDRFNASRYKAAAARGELSEVTMRRLLERGGWTCREEWREASI